MKTVFVKPREIKHNWYIIDAAEMRLGRVATCAAHILRGKNKPEYTPHQEVGDHVIIVNAEKVAVTGRKAEQKLYYRHSGYPGALRAEPFAKLIRRKPCMPLQKAVYGMLPHNSLGRKLFTNLKVYAGATHPHAAQKPIPVMVK